MKHPRRVVAQVALGLLVLGLAYAAVHVRQVHNRSYEYRWSPSAAAPRIQFDGRDYNRSLNPPTTTLPVGKAFLGRTEGGGRIFGPADRAPGAPTVLHVVADGRAFEYALSGSP